MPPPPHRRQCPSVPSTLSHAIVSCYFDIRDTNNTWTPAIVQRVDMENQRILVHYLDWPSRWDEYIPFPSPRIARYLSKRPDDTYGRPRQRNIATITNLKYGYHRHQAITALDKVGDVDVNGQRNFMAALQWLQNNVDVPSDEEDEIYMDDYILPSDVEYTTDEQEEEEEEEEEEEDENEEEEMEQHQQQPSISSQDETKLSFHEQQQQPLLTFDDDMNKHVSEVIRNAIAALAVTPSTTITLSAISSNELTPTSPSMSLDTMSMDMSGPLLNLSATAAGLLQTLQSVQ